MSLIDGKKANLTSSEELELLRKEVVRLLEESSALKDKLTGSGSSRLAEVNHQLLQQVAELENRIQQVEKENQDFAGLCVQVQEQNESITNLYVASHRLHATVKPDEVIKIILEILVELVGAEVFGVFMLDDKGTSLQLMAGEAVENRLPSRSIPAGEGVIGEVAASGQAFYYEPQGSSELEARLPLAAVPINMNGTPVGVIVIYKLLNQKPCFSSVDHQLLQLLAADAATALVTAQLHQATDRKLRTIEGFVQLMKSQ